MPIIRICSRPGCGQPTQPKTHHCQRHADMEKLRRSIKDKRAGYSSKHWQHTRALALEAAGHMCAHCHTTTNLTVHIHPYLNGNHHLATITDCQVLCRTCHGTIDAARSHHKTTTLPFDGGGT